MRKVYKGLDQFWQAALDARRNYPIAALQLGRDGDLYGQEGQGQEVLIGERPAMAAAVAGNQEG